MTHKILTLSKVAGASFLIAGVFSASAAMAKTHNHSHAKTAQPATVAGDRIYVPESQRYQKPGSPIRYSYSLPKTIEVGQTAVLELSLSEPFEAGNLEVKTRAKGDLSLHGNSGADVFSMAGNNAHEMQISFTVNSLGRHYIQVQAVSDVVGYGPRHRYFSIPVQVGPKQPLAKHSGYTVTPEGQAIIVMEATEEIK